jgi:hypothetical protein
MRRQLLLLALVSSWVGASSAAAQPASSELLSHVREAHRASLPAELEVSSIDVLPRYDLHLSIAGDLHGFGLREVVTVTNTETRPMTDVVLRIFVNATPPEGMTPQVTLVGGRCVGDPAPSCEVVQGEPTVITVTPSAPIPVGGSMQIELDLQGRLETIDPERTGMMAQGMEGMSAFESGGSGHGYGLLAQDGEIATLASFFPVIARREAGRWVTDDHGTTGDLGTDAMCNVFARVVIPSGATLAATGEATRRRPVRDAGHGAAREEVTVHAGVIRDFALVLGTNLVTLERDVGGVTVRSVFRATHGDNGRLVLGYAAAALEIFERRFGPYPYTALDVVEAPLVGGAGGVEFSSMVTVATMFYDGMESGGGLGAMMGMMGGDGASPASDMSAAMLEFVTAHEVAHQWWHGIVGSDSRSHPVTDESLAQWSSVLYMEERYGAERAATELERQVALGYVTMRVNGFADAAADSPASAYDPPVTYGGIVYGKAPFLWVRLRERLGDFVFFAGLRQYVARYRMRIAPPDGLLEIFAGEADRRTARDIRRLGHRWLSERHGDEDLGPISEDRMITAMLGPEAAAPGSPAGAMMRMMMSMLRGGGGGDMGDLSGLLGGGLGDGGEIDMEALQRMMGELDPDAAGAMLEGMDSSGGGDDLGGGGGDGDETPRPRRRPPIRIPRGDN